jgi:hypothetical protein
MAREWTATVDRVVPVASGVASNPDEFADDQLLYQLSPARSSLPFESHSIGFVGRQGVAPLEIEACRTHWGA